MTAHGRLDAYPEAGLVAYTAQLGGGVAVYCGADTYSGVPQRVLRLQGDVAAGP